MEIRLKKLHIQNFKGCVDRVVEFGNHTRLLGENGAGKTTVFDSFLWLLFNKNSVDESQFDVRPKDENGKLVDNVEISVEATMLIDDEEYVLKKVQKQKWVKKRGTATTELQGNVNEYSVNGYPKSEKEFKTFISGIIDEKVFRLVTNPHTFMKLPWKEQREMLMKFVKDLTDIQIAEVHGDRFKRLIPELKVASTEDILKKYNKAKSTLNKDMVEIPARIDEVSKQLVIVDVGALEVELAAKKAELKKVEDELNGGSSKLKVIEDKRQAVMELKFEASAIYKEASEEVNKAKVKALEVVNELVKEHADLKKKESNAIYNMDNSSRETDVALEKKKFYTDEWRRVKSSQFREYEPLPELEEIPLLTEKDMICPTCGQELPQEAKDKRIADHEEMCIKRRGVYEAKVKKHREEYESLKKSFEENREKQLEEITSKGQEASDRVRLMQKCYEEASKAFHRLREQIEAKEKEIVEAQEKYDSINPMVDMSCNENYQEVMIKVEKLENEILELSAESSGNTELEMRKHSIVNDIEEIKLKIKSADNTKVNERIAELEEEKRVVGQKLAEQEMMIDLTEEFIRVKMDRISGIVNEKFEGKVTFKLFDNQLNGGLKETCQCEWNGQTGMSNGEGIVSGIYICKALAELNDFSAPIFVDNAEAVSKGKFPEMKNQVVALCVSDDKELKVEVM